MSKKYVYLFSEGNGKMRELLGGKGANLAEMTSLGMPVPQGFTVSTEACTRYYDDGKTISNEIVDEIFNKLTELEKISGKKFGDANNPLLVSVRSGARASMPGMMDTILNLGLNDEVVKGFAKLTQNERFAYDSYRRFIQMFSDVVMEVPKHNFEEIIDEMKKEKGVELDTDLNADDLKEMVNKFKAYYKSQKGSDFPSEPKQQLLEAIKAVFRSWDNPRAIFYRRMNDIPSSWGTAVNVQMMVFGNMGDTSGTGVAFSRDPATGDKKLYGEFLINAQGEDVVAGIRTPQTIDELKTIMPEIYNQFVDIVNKLEDHYRDMQDMEFTIENKKLYMLQTRNGKRTAAAALKIACDLVDEKMIDKATAVSMIDPKQLDALLLYMLQTRNGKRTAAAALKIACDLVDEKMIDKATAVSMIDPKQLDALLHPQFDAKALKAANPIGSALPASPGAACGKVVFTAEDAVSMHNKGEAVILVRLETSPEDIEGMHVSKGILTVRGGMTSHAAVVARGMGTCCVSGCGEIKMNEKSFELGGKTINEGDYISLDGSTGKIYGEAIPTVEASISGYFETIMKWADEFRVLGVRTNADTPKDAKMAASFGAEGIGLCRTEHMFFESDRIKAMREMIVAKTEEQRRNALDKLLPMQRGDFEELYEAMQGNPVTIRYLDPPLHEFLPHSEADIADLAKEMNMQASNLKAVVDSLHEFNPMMGHRGCRLAVSYPEIAEMQTKAVIEAAINVKKKNPSWNIVPEIMIPLVGDVKELQFVKKVVVETADKLIAENNSDLVYKVGTMIEIPRAALTADDIAKEADFFSFGTNDLTQMTFGFSRDDAGSFLEYYYSKKIYENDPFAKIDQNGVGKLVEAAVKLGKSTNPNIKLGICGEHGGDPSSVEFCHNAGLNYVSCSPFRVPIARLAAAQAAIKNK